MNENIFSNKPTNEIIVIKLSDRVDTFSAPDLREYLSRLLSQGKYNFIADLTAVTFLDSAGLAALVNLLKEARDQGGDVKIILPENQNVQRIFSLTRFDRVFDIQLSIQTAVGSF